MPTLIAPAVAAIWPATAATAFTIGATAITYASIIATAITIAGSIAYASYQSSKLKRELASQKSGINQGQTVMTRNSLSPRECVYGRVLKAGALVFMSATGDNNSTMNMVMILAAHECNAVSQIKFDSNVLSLDGSGNETGIYAGNAKVKVHLGKASQAADADLIATCPAQWTSAHTLSGCCYIYAQVKYNPTIFTGGLPNITALVDGKKVWDPRSTSVVSVSGSITSGSPTVSCASVAGISAGQYVQGRGIPVGSLVTSVNVGANTFTMDMNAGATDAARPLNLVSLAWSQNAALCVGDYLTDPVFGKGIGYNRLTAADLITSANNSDESVGILGGGTEPRYTINGVVSANQSPSSVIPDMLSAMQGEIADTGGFFSVVSGYYRTPTVELTDADLAGPITVQTRQSRRDTFNIVKGVFVSPANAWAATDFPPVPNSTYIAQDNGKELPKDVTFSFVTSPATAQRCAKIDLERGRQQITVTALYSMKAVQLACCDTAMLTRAALGWNQKPFELTKWTFQPYGDPKAPSLGISCVFQEITSGVFNWANGAETTIDLAPNTNLPNPGVVVSPTLPTLTSDVTTVSLQADGTAVPTIKLAWTAPLDPFVTQGGQIQIQYRVHGTVPWFDWAPVPGASTSSILTNVLSGTNYDVQLRSVNSVGNPGAWVSAGSAVATTYAGAPAAPSAVVATAGSGLMIDVAITGPTDGSIKFYEIWRGTSSGGPFSYVGKEQGTNWKDIGVTLGTQYFYQVRAVNRSGVVGAFSATSNGATATQSSLANPTAPSTPSAPSLSGSGSTYVAGDGGVYSIQSFTLPGLPAGASFMLLLYRVTGTNNWLGTGDEISGSGTWDISELSPNTSYDYALVAANDSGVQSALSTVNTFTSAQRNTLPTAPAAGSVQGGDAVPPCYISVPPQWCLGGLASWSASPDKAIVGYNVKATATDSDAAIDYTWLPAGQSTGPSFVTGLSTPLYFQGVGSSHGYVRVQAVNTSGVAGNWLRIGDIFSVASVRIGSLATQSQSAVKMTGVQIAGASLSSSAKVIAVDAPDTGVYTTTGGAPKEKFYLGISSLGFTTKPKQGQVTLNSQPSGNGVYFFYDYDDTGNSSTQAAIYVMTTDGTNIPASVGFRYGYRFTA